ncbi:MAG: CocE/NonD family hydrolase, partial [Herbiconiux sp.]|nr:CocE/NonD family hydrolase [Herbiconiux sp.]
MKLKRYAAPAVIALTAALALSACASNEDTAPAADSTGAAAGTALTGTLTGIGASSQGSAQEAWIAAFQTANPDVTINYDPQGSGAGRESFISGAAAFAGSDSALSDDELAGTFASCAPDTKAIDLPVYISPIAVVFNVEGVDELNLDAATLANIFSGKITTWNDFVAHPNYDAFWKRQSFAPNVREVKVPTLNVAAWWDQEDFYGPMAIYQALEAHDPHHLNHLVVGPWKHGGARVGPGDSLGKIQFDSSTAKYYREAIEVPWFAHYLKDRGALDLPKALTFEAGSNQWRRWDAWPPVSKVREQKLYFGAQRSLSFTAPATTGADSYVADPAHPVPYRQRPIQATYFPGGSNWSTWLVEDQRFVDRRPDVLSWESAPLEADLTIAGEVKTQLYAATTGSDADWVVKL